MVSITPRPEGHEDEHQIAGCAATPVVTNSGRDLVWARKGLCAMYGIMDGGMMWCMGSSWLVLCIVTLLGAAALFAYLFFSRR